MFGLQFMKSPLLTRPELWVWNRLGESYKCNWSQCQPSDLSWQWSVKDSADIQNCSLSTLKPKKCPKRRFFPRFRKKYVREDITSCRPKPKKKQTWMEYFKSFLAEDPKPPLAMCRKMFELRKKRCEENWRKCGSCVPTEWYGQGVVHSFCISLPEASELPMVRFCPPPDHIKPRCAVAKIPDCTQNQKLSCLEPFEYKVPFSSFKGGPSSPAKQYIIKCNVKCLPNLSSIHDKSAKLRCKTYGEFKGVECPKNMFTRFMNVDLPGGTLKPVVVSEHKQQREIKKGVCGRSTFCEPRSIRNYHKSASDEPQPAQSSLKIEKLAKIEIGKDNTVLIPKKNPPKNNLRSLEDLEKTPEKVVAPKTTLQRLMLMSEDKKRKLREDSACSKAFNAKKNHSIEHPFPIRKYHIQSRVYTTEEKEKEEKCVVPKRKVTVKEVFHCRNVINGEKVIADISFPKCDWESFEEKDETEELFGKFERKNFFADNSCLYKDDTKKYFICEFLGRNDLNLRQMRSFHSSARVLDEFGEQRNDTGYLQPSKSTLSVVKLAKRAGFDIQSLPQKEHRFKPKKNILRRLLAKEQPKEEKVEKVEEAPPLDEKPPAVSLIRQLSKKQEEMRKQKLLKLREEEDIILNQRRKFHSSAVFRKDKKEEEKEEYLPPICSGCQGIAKALEDFDKPRGKISCSTRGAGKCRGIKRKDGGSAEAKTLHNRCKFIPYGRCRQPREEVCEVERDYGISCMDAKNKNKKKFHTSAAAQSAVIMADDYCPWVPAKRHKKQELTDVKPKLDECPRDPTRKRKDCAKIEQMKNCVPQKTTTKTYICKLAGFFGIGCGRKMRTKNQKN